MKLSKALRQYRAKYIRLNLSQGGETILEYIVYSINCKVNGKKYFGRSQELEKRWRSHRNMLRKGTHNNVLLQNDWDNYGEDNFEFKILEVFHNKDEAEICEQKYIDSLAYEKYNISNAMDGGDTFTNNPRREEIRKLKSKNSSGDKNPMFGKPKNDFTIKRIKEVNSKKVMIDGVLYDSLTHASKELNIGITTVSYRLKSESFTNWQYAV